MAGTLLATAAMKFDPQYRPCLWILAATLLAYSLLAPGTWLNYDDYWLVRDNSIIKNASCENFSKIWTDFSLTTRLQLGAEYLPLRDSNMMLAWHLWGDKAAAYKLGNLFFYLLALMLLYHWLQQLHPSLAGMATLLFALHPVHVEAVAWIASRKDMLALVFVFAALSLLERWLRQRRWQTWVGLLLCCSAAVFSKYTAMALFPIIIGRMLWQRRKIDFWRHDLLPIAQLLLLGCCHVALILYVGNQVGMQGSAISTNHLVTLFTIADIARRYLSMLLLPIGLVPMYEVTALPLSGWQALPTWFFIGCGGLVLMAWWGLTRRQWRRRAWRTPIFAGWFWLLWLLMTWLPVSQLFFSLQNKMADRYLLLPSLAFCVGLASLANLGQRWRYLLYVIVVLYGGLTWVQVGHWQDSLSLWRHAVQSQPQSASLWFKLSTTYRDQKDYMAEQAVLQHLLQIQPQHTGARNNLGINRYHLGESAQQLIPYYHDLVQQQPLYAKSWHNLGFLYLQTQQYSQAISSLQRALALQPDYCLAQQNLAVVWKLAGDATKAAAQQRQAAACNPLLQIIRPQIP